MQLPIIKGEFSYTTLSFCFIKNSSLALMQISNPEEDAVKGSKHVVYVSKNCQQ